MLSGKNTHIKREEIVIEDTLLHAERDNIVFRDFLKRKHFPHPGGLLDHHNEKKNWNRI